MEASSGLASGRKRRAQSLRSRSCRPAPAGAFATGRRHVSPLFALPTSSTLSGCSRAASGEAVLPDQKQAAVLLAAEADQRS